LAVSYGLCNLQGGGWECARKEFLKKVVKQGFKLQIMDVLLVFVGMLFLMAMVIGLYGYEEIDISIGVKQWDSPYYQFGISFVEHTLSDGNIEQELSINLFLINLNIVFYKIRA